MLPPNPKPRDKLPIIDFRGCGCGCGCGCCVVFELLALTGLLLALAIGTNLPVCGSFASGGGVSASYEDKSDPLRLSGDGDDERLD